MCTHNYLLSEVLYPSKTSSPGFVTQTVLFRTELHSKHFPESHSTTSVETKIS